MTELELKNLSFRLSDDADTDAGLADDADEDDDEDDEDEDDEDLIDEDEVETPTEE